MGLKFERLLSFKWRDFRQDRYRDLKVKIFKDLAGLLACIVSLTLIISFAVFYTYHFVRDSQTFLMAAFAILSFVFSTTLLILWRTVSEYEIKTPSERDKLDQSLLEVGRIHQEVSLEVEAAPVMTRRYPASLIRIFALGACVAASGLLVGIIGVLAANLKTQVGGSTIFAVGCVLVTLAVMQGESLNRPSP